MLYYLTATVDDAFNGSLVDCGSYGWYTVVAAVAAINSRL